MLLTYTDTLSDRIPLVDNKEFKTIKNHVIKEALRIKQGNFYDEKIDIGDEQSVVESETVTDEPAIDTEFVDFGEFDKRAFAKKSWWTNDYKIARKCLYGNEKVKLYFQKAMALLCMILQKCIWTVLVFQITQSS